MTYSRPVYSRHKHQSSSVSQMLPLSNSDDDDKPRAAMNPAIGDDDDMEGSKAVQLETQVTIRDGVYCVGF